MMHVRLHELMNRLSPLISHGMDFGGLLGLGDILLRRCCDGRELIVPAMSWPVECLFGRTFVGHYGKTQIRFRGTWRMHEEEENGFKRKRSREV